MKKARYRGLTKNTAQLMSQTEGDLPRKLDPVKVCREGLERITLDQKSFERMHAVDAMASEKLAEGISGFTSALETLEVLLEERLALISGCDVGAC